MVGPGWPRGGAGAESLGPRCICNTAPAGLLGRASGGWVECWRVAGPEHRGGGTGRQDRGPARPRPRAWSAVAGWAPGKQAIAKDQKRGRWIFRQQDEGAIWESAEGFLKPDLAARARLDAGDVEGPVHGCGRRVEAAEGPSPRHLECPKILAPALAAWAVAGGESGRLVEKEQLGVLTGRHDRAAQILERKPATDPVRMSPARCAEPPSRVVQDTAVAHQGAACRIRDNLARGRDPILQRHRRPLCGSRTAP